MLSSGAFARGTTMSMHDWESIRHSPMVAATCAHERLARVTLDDVDRSTAASSDDVGLIIRHFARSLGADAWALTSVPDQGETHCLAAEGLDEAAQAALLRFAEQIEPRIGHHAPVPIWFERQPVSPATTTLVIPVQRTPGHASTFVNLVFGQPNEEQRREVEIACLRDWPSVAAYMRLWQFMRLAQRRSSGVEAGLNLVAIGIVLLSGDGHIAFANDTARLLMDRQDGIREHRGQVQATDRSDAATLLTAIQYVLSQNGVAKAGDRMPLLMLRREHGPPLVTSFVRAPRSDLDDGDGALLFFVDPGLDIHQLAEPVCKLFRLSRVETELACLLASGQTLATAAQSLHVKLGTARGYLKQVFVKTGSNRQVDLVRLIFSNLVRTSMSERPKKR